MPANPPPPAGQIYQIKLTLLEVEPEIWRRLLLPASINIADLHFTIQAAMGWDNYHLHTFTIRGKEYGIDYEDGVSFADDPREVRLAADPERFLRGEVNKRLRRIGTGR